MPIEHAESGGESLPPAFCLKGGFSSFTSFPLVLFSHCLEWQPDTLPSNASKEGQTLHVQVRWRWHIRAKSQCLSPPWDV